MSWLSTAAASVLVLSSFGQLPELLTKQNPWTGFSAEGPQLLVVRAERFSSRNCQMWQDALLSDSSLSFPLELSGGAGKEGENSAEVAANTPIKIKMEDWKAWEPFEKDDLKAVEQCDSFPCPVKFDRSETALMKAVGLQDPTLRMNKFLELVRSRITGYLKTQIRREYEFPGDPVDPWKYFEEKGLLAGISRPTKPSLRLRKLDFAPGKIRMIRQVLDRRSARSPKGAVPETAIWIRDVYTDHYFDSWGEWGDIRCENPGGFVLVQALFTEFDLLKKSDLFSQIAHGKMKSAIEENGQKFLKDWTDRLKKTVERGKKSH